MTWLKRIGQIILNGAELAAGIGPFVKIAAPQSAAVVDTVVSDLQQIKGIIVQVEAIGQAFKVAGPDKLRVAGPLVAQVIAQSAVMTGHQIANVEAYNKACETIAGGMADLLNSLKEPASVQSLAA